MSSVRVSCSSLVRIGLDGKILVVVNHDSAQEGRRVYTPFGGVLAADSEGARYLTERLGCTFEGEDTDLRLRVDKQRLRSFEEWFFSYTGRETSPHRELEEELVDEENVFVSLPESAYTLGSRIAVEERKITDKPGQAGQMTQRYFEVWGLRFSEPYAAQVRKHLARPDTQLLLATTQEIRQLHADDGREIRDSCLALVLDTATVPRRVVHAGGKEVTLYRNG